MGFIKGGATLCRYRILEEPDEGLTDEFVGQRLKKNAFSDIEDTPEESSIGWVEIINYLSASFYPGSFSFGNFLAFTLRQDERKLSAKTLNRYYAIREAKFITETGRKPNTIKKTEMKESLRLDLLRRSLLSTNLYQVVWLKDEAEVWLDGTSEKIRALFEDYWARTFGLALRLIVPVSLGIELMPEKFHQDIIRLMPSSIWV
ncbi:MAG: recombination-associated protein RdgC [Deltaproteobacteria bacterium]|jgi:DNA recombination-dependent growth factor C|nr:recombination-associated protein RdgC [Deltaproteobacteria bacterium]